MCVCVPAAVPVTIEAIPDACGPRQPSAARGWLLILSFSSAFSDSMIDVGLQRIHCLLKLPADREQHSLNTLNKECFTRAQSDIIRDSYFSSSSAESEPHLVWSGSSPLARLRLSSTCPASSPVNSDEHAPRSAPHPERLITYRFQYMYLCDPGPQNQS